LENAYGKLAAIESVVSIFQKGGPKLQNVMARNLVVDPTAEMPDGTDATWMAERCYVQTSYLKYKFTRKDEDKDCWYYVFKPTHKAVFSEGSGASKDDAFGLVLQTLSGDPRPKRTMKSATTGICTLRSAGLYGTKQREELLCSLPMIGPILFGSGTITQKPLGSSPTSLSVLVSQQGKPTTVGEVSYYLDQQDEINQINRQAARIRNSVFNFFFYNSHKISQADAEILMRRSSEVCTDEQSVIGVKVPEGRKDHRDV
jgi:hypothetical protein